MNPTLNLYNHFQTIAKQGNFQTLQNEDVLAVCSKLAHPGFNYTICLNPNPDKNLIQSVKDFFQKHGTHSFVWFQSGNTESTRKILESEGLGFTAPIVSLAHNLEDIPLVPQAPELHIKKAETTKEFQEWQNVFANTWDRSAEMTHDFFNNALKDSLLETSPLNCYVAYWNDIPAGSCCLDYRDPVGGLYWGAVMPAYLKRGIGIAMINVRLHIAKEHGATQGIVQCLESSLGICKANGFEETGTLAAFLFSGKM